jgi:hypothetical protein
MQNDDKQRREAEAQVGHEVIPAQERLGATTRLRHDCRVTVQVTLMEAAERIAVPATAAPAHPIWRGHHQGTFANARAAETYRRSASSRCSLGRPFRAPRTSILFELSFRIEVEDDLARRSSASTRRSTLGVDR